MKNDPHTPSPATTTEQLTAHQRPALYDNSTQTLEQLVKQYGYRKTSVIIGCSTGYISTRLRLAQAKIPRGRDAVQTFEVRWHHENAEAQVPGEPAILTTLRQNLETFLRRAEHIGTLSTTPNRKSPTMEAHLRRITTALARLAMLHLQHAERATLTVPWQDISNTESARALLYISNLLERLTQGLAAMLLWRDQDEYRTIPQVYQTIRPSIVIYHHTLGIPSTRSAGRMTYGLIAEINHTNRKQIKKPKRRP